MDLLTHETASAPCDESVCHVTHLDDIREACGDHVLLARRLANQLH